MAFWIVSAVVLIVALLAFYFVGNADFRYFDISEAFAGFFCVLIFGSLVGAIALGVWGGMNSHTKEYRDTESIQWELKALGNDSQIAGQSYFLGGGYIGEKQVIQYITKASNGAIRVEKLDAAEAKIFEGSEKAHLIRTKTVSSMPWLVPWDIETVYHHDFYIPEGSVTQDYTLDVTPK